MGDDYMKAEAKSPHTILDKAIALERRAGFDGTRKPAAGAGRGRMKAFARNSRSDLPATAFSARAERSTASGRSPVKTEPEKSFRPGRSITRARDEQSLLLLSTVPHYPNLWSKANYSV